MKSSLALSTRIGVAILVSLTLITAAVTGFVVSNPKDAVSNVTAPAVLATPTPTASGFAGDPVDRAYAINLLVHSDEIEAGSWPERTLEDLLPNRVFAFDGGEAQPLAAGIVVGTVTAASEGIALDSMSGKPVDFYTTPAAARVVVLTIAVEHGFGDVSGNDSVEVGVRINGESDPDELLAGLAALGRTIIVVDAVGRYAFDPTLYSSRGSARLVGTVSSDGTIDFPALVERSSEFVGTLTTVDQLVVASTRAAEVGEISNGKVVGP